MRTSSTTAVRIITQVHCLFSTCLVFEVFYGNATKFPEVWERFFRRASRWLVFFLWRPEDRTIVGSKDKYLVVILGESAVRISRFLMKILQLQSWRDHSVDGTDSLAGAVRSPGTPTVATLPRLRQATSKPLPGPSFPSANRSLLKATSKLMRKATAIPLLSYVLPHHPLLSYMRGSDTLLPSLCWATST